MKKYSMTAECVKVGPIETIGTQGYRKRIIILCEDQDAQYPNYLVWELGGDRVNLANESMLGKELTVEGYPRSRSWKDKSGVVKYFTTLQAITVKSKVSNNYNSVPEPPRPTETKEDSIDDVPF